MVVSSNRSPSPLSTRPNSNPRTSETHPNQPTRKSFSGSSPFARPSVLTNSRSFNPITPANSPADVGRRQYVGKEGAVASSWGCEEKENEKDHSSKVTKLQSPAKGSKNFMSPTISAASKFTPSPRKKVLVERNDPVRTSMTLSDGKATFFSTISSDVTEDFDEKSDVGMDQKHTEAARGSTMTGSYEKEAVYEGPLVCKPVKKVTFKELTIDSHDSTESLVEKVSVALDSVNVEWNTKNKPYCSSVESLSDTVALVSDCVTDELSSKNKPYCSSVESLSDTVSMASDCVNVESRSKEKHPCPPTLSPIIAPLDADPSFPPYDPKNNYLFPRPQFLHFKPKPRIELLLHKEEGLDFGETKQLEDSFMCEMSENLSDSEGTEESQTADSQKEPDEASSVQMVPEAEEQQVSESLPVSTPVADEIPEEMVETRRPRKSHFLTRWKSVSMLLVFLIACVSISVTDSPVMDSFVLNNVNFMLYEPSEVATFAKLNVDGFTGKLKQWSANSVSYLLKLIPVVDEVDKLGPLQFINLTAIQDESLQFFKVDRGSKVCVENLAQDEVEEEEEVEDEIESPKEEVYTEADIDDGNEKYLETLDGMEIAEVPSASSLSAEVNELEIPENLYNQEQTDYASKSESESRMGSENLLDGTEIAEVPAAPTLLAEGNEPKSSQTVHNQEQTYLASKSESESRMDHSVSVPQASDIKFDVDASEIEKKVTDTEILRNDIDLGSSARVESNTMDIDQESSSEIDHYFESVQIPEVQESSFGKSDDNIRPRNVLGLSLLSLAVVAVAVFFYRKHRNTTAPVVRDIDSLFHKKMMQVGPEHILQEKTYSQNWATEVDVVGESCPSEMSSFGKSSYYSRRELMQGSEAHSHERKPRKSTKRESLASSSSEYSMQGSEAHSHERKPRKSTKRESLASSSSEYSMSPSYGSFTTYERIPTKHASGDEEIVTPVRRSSRLRSQVTSQ